jgi:hypothetical protein
MSNSTTIPLITYGRTLWSTVDQRLKGGKPLLGDDASSYWLLSTAAGVVVGAGAMVYLGPALGFSPAERVWTSVAGGAVGAAGGYGLSLAMSGWELLGVLTVGGAAIATGAIIYKSTEVMGQTGQAAMAAAPAVVGAIPSSVWAAAAV